MRGKNIIDPASAPPSKTATMTLRLSLKAIELIRYVSATTGKTCSEVVQDAVLVRYKHLLDPSKVKHRGELKL